jgi:hypothetical protein
MCSIRCVLSGHPLVPSRDYDPLSSARILFHPNVFMSVDSKLTEETENISSRSFAFVSKFHVSCLVSQCSECPQH